MTGMPSRGLRRSWGEANYKITALDGSAFEMPRSIYPGDFHILATPR